MRPSEGCDDGSIPSESTKLRSCALNGYSEAGLFAVCCVALNDAALGCFIDCLVGDGKEFFSSSDILFGERGQERFRRAVESLLASDIEDVFPRRGANRFLCRAGNCHKNRLWVVA